MASGPSGTGGWRDLMNDLNIRFKTDSERKQFAKLFKDKHGKKGDGADPNTKPYKFGQFVDQGALLPKDKDIGRFLIDSGSNRWDGSRKVLEDVIRYCLTREVGGTPDPVKITFTPNEDASATRAKAEITDHAGNAINDINDPNVTNALEFKITITCPKPSP